MLRQRQHVAVGIVEPGDAVIARGGPHAELVLVHAVEAQQFDAGVDERAGRRDDVVDGPAEDGERLR